MSRIPPLPLLAATAVLLLIAAAAPADVGPGLYVSEAGEDTGGCTAIESPCATIGYALSVAAKNTRVHVAVGTYVFDSAEAILYAMTGAVHVHGGYVTDDRGQWIKGGVAYLTGVPPGYREFFSKHGFVVIADAKGSDGNPDTAAQMLAQYQQVQQSVTAADCVSGIAAGFECSGISLLSQTARRDFSSAPASVADIWGYVDLNTRREYVIVGVRNGTAVFDVTDPEKPREVGFVGGQSATWRDIKIYQFFDEGARRWRAHGYVTTDGAADGLFVIDLSELPHRTARVPYASDFSNAHNVYLTDTDYSTGIRTGDAAPQLIVAGSGIDNGQFRSYSIADPASPSFRYRVGGTGYMHDASSLNIADSRAEECSAPGTCNVLLDFNEESVELWDLSIEGTATLLATAPTYATTGYVHSGWWTEDRRYVFVHDELDERNFGLPTTLRVLSLDSLRAPTLAGQWAGSDASIDHNGFVRGNRYYMATYTSGLKVLDITDATRPVEVGAFDTYPASDSATFAGAWGAYPYLPSGTIAVSDINSGLYLLRDDTRAVAAGTLRFTSASFGGTEGNTVDLTVERVGSFSGAVDVGFEVVAATADRSDVTVMTKRVSWAAGESGPRNVQVALAADGTSEDLEELLVRLEDVRGGATLGEPNLASLFIGDPAAPVTLALDAARIELAEQGPGLAVVTVRRNGSAKVAASIDFAVTGIGATAGSDFNGPADGTLRWPDGDGLPRSIEFEILADADDEPAESFQVSFANASNALLEGDTTATVIIRDGTGSNSEPVVTIGPDQQRLAGSNVMLDGSGSFDPDGDAVTYAWTQETGPDVVLSGSDTEAATFIAPDVESRTALRFRLKVTDDRGLSASATTVVTVTPSSQNAPGAGGGGAPHPAALLLLLGLAGLRRLSLSPANRMDCAG